MQVTQLTSHIKKHKLIYLLIPIIFFSLFALSIPSKPTVTITTPQKTSPTPMPKRVEGQIVVKFKPGVTEEQIQQELIFYNAKIVNKIPAINRVVIQVPKNQTDAILERLSKDGLIEIAEPDYLNYSHVINDPSFGNQWGLKNTGQTIQNQAGTPKSDINIEAAWTVTKGKGVKVAIIDTGININHPDLAGKIVAQRNVASNTNNVEDSVGHGTHSAGTIAANVNNAQGIAGICPDCKLIIVKDVNGEESIPDSSIASGITWATDQGAQVINVSQGGEHPLSQEIRDALNYAMQKGAIVVAAAANCGADNYASNGCTKKNPSNVYPAAASGVVSVTAIDNRDQKPEFANSGTWIKVAAPGNSIYSTVPTHSYGLQKMDPNFRTNYEYFSGTSMATPVAAGVLALIRSTSYGTTANAAIQRLYATADRIPGTGTLWQYGRINAGKAVGAASPTPVAGGVPSPQCLGACPSPTLMEENVTPSPTIQPTDVPLPTTILPTEVPTLAPVDPAAQDPNTQNTGDQGLPPSNDSGSGGDVSNGGGNGGSCRAKRKKLRKKKRKLKKLNRKKKTKKVKKRIKKLKKQIKKLKRKINNMC